MDRIIVDKISKEYKNFLLDDFTFPVKEGYITGFIGPNGSGKTTTIKAIINLINLDSGKIIYHGYESHDKSYLEEVGIVLDESYLAHDFTIKNVDEVMKIGYDNWNSDKFYKLIDFYNIDKNLKVGELSRGMSTKLMMAVSLCHSAKTLILDEPTSGLDPSSREVFREKIQEFMEEDEKNTVLFSTHITEDLEAIADFIVFIIDGKKVYYGSKDEFLETFIIIKTSKEDLTKINPEIIIGKRVRNSFVEALIERKYLSKLNFEFVKEIPTIDQIMTFYNREELI